MYNIAVCDGNTADAVSLAAMLRGLCAEMGISVSVESFRTARALYEAFKEKRYQLVFLETEIGGMNGIDLARKIRFQREETDVIFVTAKEDYALAAYSVFPLGYILKNVTRKKLYEPLHRALRRHLRLPSIFLQTPIGNEISVRIDDIIYIEVFQTDLTVYCRHAVHNCVGSLGGVLEKLPEGCFYRSHRNFIVNLQYVTEIGRYFFVTEGGERVPVAKNRYTEARSIFEEYTQN